MPVTCTNTCGSSPSRSSTPATLSMSRVSQAGEAAAKGAAKQLAQLRQDRGEVTVTITRRELRKWLRESTEGKAAEEAVEKLLGTGQVPANPPPGGH